MQIGKRFKLEMELKKETLIEQHGHSHKESKVIGITLWKKIGLKKRWEELQSNSKKMNDSLSHFHSFSKVSFKLTQTETPRRCLKNLLHYG